MREVALVEGMMRGSQDQLFGAVPAEERLGPGSIVLRGFALPTEQEVLEGLERVTESAPFRHMTTPGGFLMSVAMTNCGRLGWVTDQRGYRYEPRDPISDRLWPAMPDAFVGLASRAAAAAGYPEFDPDTCLINRYTAKAKMSLHQDKDETDFRQPIVSVSLGLAANFQFGGLKRADPVVKTVLAHGDVVVWGGADRLRFHGILPLKPGEHPRLGPYRINLTFRRAAA